MEKEIIINKDSYYSGSTIRFCDHRTNETLVKIRDILDEVFCEDDEFYVILSLDDYRDLMLEAQNTLNQGDGIVQEIVGEIESQVFEYFSSDKILIQSNLYLRASRPNLSPESENIGWHRETFYGSNMESSVNCWTPIRGVDENNTLRYIPNSETIRDEDIVVEYLDSKITEKFSSGHKLGFQYKPKKIVSGVDLSKSHKMVVDYGKSSLFSGNLIHGAAENCSNMIRFSIDFRMIKKSDYNEREAKQTHFSSGNPYFVEYNPKT